MTQVSRTETAEVYAGSTSNGSSNVATPDTKTSNSVVNPMKNSTENSADQIVKSGNDKNKKLSARIEMKLIECEVKYKELGSDDFKSFLLKNIGYSDKLEPERQIVLLEALSSILDYYISEKNNNKIAEKDYNIKYDILVTTQNLINVLDNCHIESFKEYKQLTKTDNTGFKKAKTDKQKIKAVRAERERIINKIIERRDAELKKCTTQEAKDNVNKIYDDLIGVVEVQIQIDQTRHNAKNDSKLFVYAQDAKDQPKAHNLAINLYNPEAQQDVADSFTHEFEMNLLQNYYEFGDPISAEDYGNIVSTIMQYKSEEGAQQYISDAEAFDGENAPWYTEEHAEAEAKGIEEARILSGTNNSQTQPKTQTQTQTQTEVTATSTSGYNNGYSPLQTINISRNNTTEPASESYETKKATVQINNKSNSKDIAEAIKNGELTVLDAISRYPEKGFDAVFEDPDIFARNKAIALIHINNFRNDLEKLLSLSNFSTAIELIATHISPRIKEEYSSKVDLSAITKDAIFGKEEINAAA